MRKRMFCRFLLVLLSTIVVIHTGSSGVIGDACGADPPSVSISANPVAVAPGRSSTLTWKATNAAACAIDQGIGMVAVSGSKKITVAATKTYTITATGPGGKATASVTVAVAPRPTVTFSANPANIRPGETSTLTWSATDTTYCFADWLAKVVPVSGSAQVSPAKTGPYTIMAVGPGGTVQRSLRVTVVNPAVTLSANPVTINRGDVSVLSWSSAGSNSCVIDQGIGSVAPTGSITVSPTQTTTYTVTSTDPLGGTATAAATITVV